MDSSIKQFSSGVKSYILGYRWLKQHPRYLILCFFPILLSVTLMGGSLGWLIGTMDSLLSSFWIPAPDNWWKTILHYLASGIVRLLAVYLAFTAVPIVSNILSSPIYEWISLAIEKDFGIKQEETSWQLNLLIMRDEFLKMLVMLIITLTLMLIPGFGILAPLVTAFFLGWSAFDFPLARRGWNLSKRWNLVRNHIFSITGLGVWLMIPILQIALMPMAIAGGTLLSLDALGFPKSERNRT